MKSKTRNGLRITVSSVLYLFAIIFIVVIFVATSLTSNYASIITQYFGHRNYDIVETGDGTEDTEYFKRKYTTEADRIAAASKLCEEIEGEGVVLLKNVGNTLPLAQDAKKITLLGNSSYNVVYGGAGSGVVNTKVAVSLQSALKNAEYSINATATNFYTSGTGSRYGNSSASLGGGSYIVNECPGFYLENQVTNFTNYGDAAIVTFSRAGSEEADLPIPTATNRSYLELSLEEESVLAYASKHFDKVIVLINSATPMELGFLNDYTFRSDNASYSSLNGTQIKVGACLWIGNPGQSGFAAIPKVLTGEINPSGGLVDTYAYDTLSAPSVVNQSSMRITNSGSYDHVSGYLVYAEGIYVGYKYYETRYEDTVLKQGNSSENVGVTKIGATSWNYSDEVQFPFGYNSSYTNFEWSGFTVTENKDSFDVSLSVKNIGDREGKDIVQIYLQSPYTTYDKQNHIEKASVELVGFKKTSKLAIGESETITITVNKEQLATYDAYGAGTYVLDAGTYYLAAGNNAHDALNNILAAKGKSVADGMDYDGNSGFVKSYDISAQDNKTYSISQETGYKIVNQFDDVDIKTYDGSFKYLSRNDWKNTYPVKYKDGEWTFTEEMLKGTVATDSENIYSNGTTEMPKQNIGNGLTLAMLMGADWDSTAWDDLLDQMSYKELADLVRMGGYATLLVKSISLPSTRQWDGPSGWTGAGGVSLPTDEQMFGWVCEVVLAATWNEDLIEEMGEMIAEDALANSQNGEDPLVGWYAPGMNIHRSAYSGRNFEYYSEDGFLSGKIGAAEIRGAVGKGVVVYMKHYALNDQETNRTGGTMFANEQSIREIYLKPYEISVREGNANGIMAAMNRVGLKWAGGHRGLMTETLRNEWGFHGIAVTDQCGFESFYYCNIRQGIAAGTTLWLNNDTSLWLSDSQLGDYESNPETLYNLRSAAKTILYTLSHSLAMNGISSTAKVVPVMPTWQKWLIGADIALGILAAGAIAIATMNVVKVVKSKKNKKAEDTTDSMPQS